jgi:diguanylate cyclase
MDRVEKLVPSPAPEATADSPGGATIEAERTDPTPSIQTGSTIEAIRDGARLAALRELHLLDVAPIEAIDRFTRLATDLLGVPVSLVSLLDEDRQFFISEQGLPESWAEAKQTPLSHSFCQHAVASREPLVIEDSREDPRVRDNLAVRDLDVIAYAGIPLILEDGAAVGAFCAIDSQPRHWTERDLRILSDLAAAVKTFLDLRAQQAHQGLHDRLTGLPNRDLLLAYCDQLMAQSVNEQMVAVVCAGLDHFSQINQAFGAERADRVLQAVADRLGRSVRDTDVLGRLRGDVFALVSPKVKDEAEALAIAGRIRDSLSASPFEFDGKALSLTATAGIATGRPGAKAADVISEAANAMHQAKRDHDGVRFTEDGWSAQAAEALDLRQALARALERGEIMAVFQPIVELDSGKLRGFETLARWTHPELGPINPAEFVPLAEITADIIPIGEFMMTQAVAQLARWRSEGHDELRVTVNVSPLQLKQANFAEVVADILNDAGLDGNAIGVEITEGALLETGEIERHNLERLKELGARIVLDDFGTGYSALGYIRRFPIEVIKIDRSFVTDMTSDRAAAALVQAILAMARAMDLEIVAEGIETVEQRQLLRLLGCALGQGYLFSRPLPGSDVPFVFGAA